MRRRAASRSRSSAIGNADNVGSVFRSAAAFGVDAVLLEPDLHRPALSKGDSHLDGRGADDAVCASRAVARRAAATWRGTAWVGAGDDAVAASRSRCARSRRRSQHRPVVVVVGHEGDGLSDAALDACTHHARIPMTNDGRFAERRDGGGDRAV